jgi:hypothetical protein
MSGLDGVSPAACNGAQEKYDTLFGEVVSAAADERAFVEGRWQFDDDKLNTCIILAPERLYQRETYNCWQIVDSVRMTAPPV